MSIVLRFFPNGEFSQGVDTSQRRDKSAHAKQRRHDPPSQECRDEYLRWASEGNNAEIHLCVPGTQFRCRDGGIYTYLCEDVNGHHYSYEGQHYVLADVLMNEPIGQMIGRGELVPLVHQSVESSPHPSAPSRKKLLAMTKSMGRNIRNAVFLLEEKYGKDCLSFLTLTLPDLSAEDLSQCCERWDYMTDQLLKAMRKRVKKHTPDFEYVYCTEIQCKRLQQRGEYAPHLHIVFRGRNGRKKPWYFTPKQIRSIWVGIVASVVGHSGFRTDAVENLQRVKYSAARYLSKYLSKGHCSLPSDMDEKPISELRTQWGGMARIQSTAVKQCTTRLSGICSHGGLARKIVSRMDELIEAGIVKYFKQGFIPISVCRVSGVERVFKVGCGCLATATYKGGLVAIAKYFDAV